MIINLAYSYFFIKNLYYFIQFSIYIMFIKINVNSIGWMYFVDYSCHPINFSNLFSYFFSIIVDLNYFFNHYFFRFSFSSINYYLNAIIINFLFIID